MRIYCLRQVLQQKKMNSAPLTFLFTDLEGSTQLWEQFPEVMQSILARHDALLRREVEKHHGRIIKTTGDGLHAVFESAVQGATAALAGQLALKSENWPVETGPPRVRMGLHTGESQERDGDYYGSEINRAARVMSVAFGEQILLSATTAGLVQQQLPTAVYLKDLGDHVLRDLIQHEHLFQLCHGELKTDFPPLNTDNIRKYSILTPTTRFVGREREIAEIQELLGQTRLLTLLGPGGMGKTRLALKVGQEMGETVANGSVVVYLQPLNSVEFFLPAIAAALEFTLSGKESPVDQLGHFLGDKEMIIVLDSFEKVLDAADQLWPLLGITDKVTFLVTSREVLNLQEEWLYPVGGLTYPLTDDDGQDGTEYAAVQLFIERAQRVYAPFKPAEEMPGINRICRLVAGMPLALELAATWRKTMTAEAIADEIQHSLDFLSTRLRNVPERHRSIQVVFDQTWQQLSESEQQVFMRLSVFYGGFQREAAQVVAGASLAVLMALVDISLLNVADDGRYQIHELLRQYAAEQLGQYADVVQQTRADHAAYYADYLDQLLDSISGGGQMEAFVAIRREIENIRVTWQFTLDEHDFAYLRKMAPALGLYYDHQGGYLEGLNLFTRSIKVLRAQPPSPDVDYALLDSLLYVSWYHLRFGDLGQIEKYMAMSQAIYARLDVPPTPGSVSDPRLPLGFVALTRGDYAAAIEHAHQARLIAEAEQHEINLQFACYILSSAFLGQGQYETARVWAQRAQEMAEISGDLWFHAYILNNMGLIAMALGDDNLAQGYFQSSYDIRARFGDPEGMALALVHLADIALQRQELSTAEEYYQRSLAIFREINDKGGVAAANEGLGNLSFQQGDIVAAKAYFHHALQLCVEINYRPLLMAVLVDIAELLWHAGRQQQALTLLSFAINNPASGQETTARARTLLMDSYQPQVEQELFESAVATAKTSELTRLTANLLAELKQPGSHTI